MTEKAMQPIPIPQPPTIGYPDTLTPFRFFCQRVLPAVYGNELSYYELLCKVTDYLNKTMENVNSLNGDVQQLEAYIKKLQEWIDSYFKNLDVQEEINNKLDQMAASGQLADIIIPIISEWSCVNVKGAGAIGDGVTDDTAAFVSAMKENGCVLVPPGTYKVNTLTVPTGCTLKGTSKAGCILTTDSENALLIIGTNCTLQNLTLSCLIQSPPNTSYGLSINGKYGYVNNVTVNGFAYGVFYYTATTDYVVTNVLANGASKDCFYIQGYGNKISECTAIRAVNGAGFHTITGGNAITDVKAFDCSYGLYMDRESCHMHITGEFQENFINNIFISSVSCFNNRIEANCIGPNAWPNGEGLPTNRPNNGDLYLNAQNNVISIITAPFNKNWESMPDQSVMIGQSAGGNTLSIDYTLNAATNQNDIQTMVASGSIPPFVLINGNKSPQNNIIVNNVPITFDFQAVTLTTQSDAGVWSGTDPYTLTVTNPQDYQLYNLDNFGSAPANTMTINITDLPDYVGFEFDIEMLNQNSAYMVLPTGTLSFTTTSQLYGYLPQGVTANRYFRVYQQPFATKTRFRIAGDLKHVKEIANFTRFNYCGLNFKLLKFKESTEENVAFRVSNVTYCKGSY